MSSPLPADLRARPPAPATVDAEPMRIVALVGLAAFAFFAQLDAVANRLSAGSPVSLFDITIAGLGAAAVAVLILGGAAPGRAIGTSGMRLMGLLVCWAVFAWSLSLHRTEGLTYLIKLSTAVGPALCVFLIADRPWKILVILWAIIAAATIAAAIVLIEQKTHTRLVATALAATTADFDGVARSSGGSDQNPTTAAQMLMVGTGLATGLLFAGERRFRMVLAGGMLIGIVALGLMSARSAIIGMALASGLTLLSFRGKSYFPAIVAVALIAGVTAVLFAPPTLIDRFAAIGDFGKDQTLYRRITYLRIGADLIGQSPIWGVGPGNFPQYYVSDVYRYMPGRELFPRELHNTYLDVATELGLVGFGIFAALIGNALLAARRGCSAGASPLLARVSFAVFIALSALLAASFFMPHKDLRYLWLMFALALQCGRLRDAEAVTS